MDCVGLARALLLEYCDGVEICGAAVLPPRRQSRRMSQNGPRRPSWLPFVSENEPATGRRASTMSTFGERRRSSVMSEPGFTEEAWTRRGAAPREHVMGLRRNSEGQKNDPAKNGAAGSRRPSVLGSASSLGHVYAAKSGRLYVRLVCIRNLSRVGSLEAPFIVVRVGNTEQRTGELPVELEVILRANHEYDFGVAERHSDLQFWLCDGRDTIDNCNYDFRTLMPGPRSRKRLSFRTGAVVECEVSFKPDEAVNEKAKRVVRQARKASMTESAAAIQVATQVTQSAFISEDLSSSGDDGLEATPMGEARKLIRRELLHKEPDLALLLACVLRDTELLDESSEAGARATAFDEKGYSVAYFAAMSGSPKLLKMVLRLDKAQNFDNRWFDSFLQPDGTTVLMKVLLHGLVGIYKLLVKDFQCRLQLYGDAAKGRDDEEDDGRSASERNVALWMEFLPELHSSSQITPYSPAWVRQKKYPGDMHMEGSPEAADTLEKARARRNAAREFVRSTLAEAAEMEKEVKPHAGERRISVASMDEEHDEDDEDDVPEEIKAKKSLTDTDRRLLNRLRKSVLWHLGEAAVFALLPLMRFETKHYGSHIFQEDQHVEKLCLLETGSVELMLLGKIQGRCDSGSGVEIVDELCYMTCRKINGLIVHRTTSVVVSTEPAKLIVLYSTDLNNSGSEFQSIAKLVQQACAMSVLRITKLFRLAWNDKERNELTRLLSYEARALGKVVVAKGTKLDGLTVILDGKVRINSATTSRIVTIGRANTGARKAGGVKQLVFGARELVRGRVFDHTIEVVSPLVIVWRLPESACFASLPKNIPSLMRLVEISLYRHTFLKSTIFGGLKITDTRLRKLVEISRKTVFWEGQTVIAMGEPARAGVILVDGEAEVLHGHDNSVVRLVADAAVNKVHFLDELGILEQGHFRGSTVKAVSESLTVIWVDEDLISQIFGSISNLLAQQGLELVAAGRTIRSKMGSFKSSLPNIDKKALEIPPLKSGAW